MEFIVNKDTKTVSITKEFDATRDQVWDAYTKVELLDQWWAPKPMASRTTVMDFREGGRRFYAMVSPEGQERWVLQQYKSITPKTNFACAPLRRHVAWTASARTRQRSWRLVSKAMASAAAATRLRRWVGSMPGRV